MYSHSKKGSALVQKNDVSSILAYYYAKNNSNRRHLNPNIVSVPTERGQKGAGGGGQAVLPPNLPHPSDHDPSLFMHGGRNEFPFPPSWLPLSLSST